MKRDTACLGKPLMGVLLLFLALHITDGLPGATADLIIKVDTSTQEYWVEGNGEFDPSDTWLRWEIDNGGTKGGSYTNNSLDFVDMVSCEPEEWGGSGNIASWADGAVVMTQEFVWDEWFDPVTLTGLGESAKVSYASWSATAIAQFEAWAAADTPFPLIEGTGATTTISEVPEPACLGLLTLGGVAMARRRRNGNRR